MTTDCSIINGHLGASFFLFLRASGRLSDAELLRELGLADFVSCSLSDDLSRPHIYFTEDEEWIHIADDWLYSLWHKGADSVATAVHRRWSWAPLFVCSV